MRSFLNIIFFLVTLSSIIGQENVVSFQDFNFKKGAEYIENYSFSNEQTGDLSIVIAYRDKLRAYLYNQDFEKIGEASAKHLTREYKEILGYSINDSRYTMVFSTENYKKFAYVSFDFNQNKPKTGEIDFSFEKERYVETIHYKGRFLLISDDRDGNLIFRELTEDFNFVDLATFNLDTKDHENLFVSDKDFIAKILAFEKNTVPVLVNKIDNTTPHNLARTISKNKLYVQGEYVHITFESASEGTILKTINLEKNTLTTSFFPYPKSNNREFKKFNSFLKGKHLFHIASSRDEMIFQIKDYDNTIIREFLVEADKPISFKNSDILIGGSLWNKKAKKKNEEAKKFLGALNGGELGISIYNIEGNVQISLGGFVSPTLGGPGIGPSGGITIASSGGESPAVYPTYNPIFYSYSKYKTSGAIYFNSLFDKDFNHIEGDLNKGVFDQMKIFQEGLSWEIAVNVFMHNQQLLFSYWNRKEQKYSLIQF